MEVILGRPCIVLKKPAYKELKDKTMHRTIVINTVIHKGSQLAAFAQKP